MTDWTPREIDVDLSFLQGAGPGAGGSSHLMREMASYVDGPDADHAAESYQRKLTPVVPGQHVRVKLAAGGGFAAGSTCAGSFRRRNRRGRRCRRRPADHADRPVILGDQSAISFSVVSLS